jgi:hypothetical protein
MGATTSQNAPQGAPIDIISPRRVRIIFDDRSVKQSESNNNSNDNFDFLLSEADKPLVEQ